MTSNDNSFLSGVSSVSDNHNFSVFDAKKYLNLKREIEIKLIFTTICPFFILFVDPFDFILLKKFYL